MDEYKKGLLEAFQSAITRSRWLLLTTILLSSLLVVHMYVENLSYQESQLRESIGKNIKYARVARVKEREEELANRASQLRYRAVDEKWTEERKEKELSALDGELREHAEYALGVQLSTKAYADWSLAGNSLPILGVAVPANDYVTVVLMMLAIFSVALWLSVHAVANSLDLLAKRGDALLFEIARMNFTFTGMVDQEREDLWARRVQGAALCAPAITAGGVAMWDLWTVIDARTESAVGPYPAAMFAQALCVLVIVAATVKTVQSARKADKLKPQLNG